MGDTVLARADSVLENQSLLTITDTKTMVIDADVAETNIAALRPGLRGEVVLDAFPDQPFEVQVMIADLSFLFIRSGRQAASLS